VIPVEIVDFENGEFKVLHRGFVSENNFAKFKLVKSEDGVVRITDMLHKNAIPEFVESIELEA
jgi:hypothetical protein